MSDIYLYQTLHLAAGRTVRNLEAHIAVLDGASRRLFGRPYAPGAEALARRIAALATEERLPTRVSGFVRLELGPDGEERLSPAGVSLYAGYAFRSLTPSAAILNYDIPFSEAPTSVREATARWARHEAMRRGADIAVRCDRTGVLREGDNAPLLCAADRVVRIAPGLASVERQLATEAVRAAGLELREEPFGRDELPQLDELFFVDHRGVTALSHCDGQPLMTLLAERVAEALEGLFAKKERPFAKK